MPNYGPAPDDRRGDANERQSGIDVDVVSPVPVLERSSDIVVKPLEWQSRGARSLALLARRIETARAAHERIGAARQARDAAEQATEKAEAELHAKLLAKNAAYDGMYAVLDETKQDRMVVAPQLRNAGQTVVFARDPDYRPVRIAELALRDRQADFEAALKARLPAGWEGDVDAPDFISLADVEPWLTALLSRIRALRDFQPSGDAAVSLTAHDLRNFYRILDHLQINDRPTRPPTPADMHQAEAAVSDLLAWVRRRLAARTMTEIVAELRARLVAVRDRAEKLAVTVSPDDFEHEGEAAPKSYQDADNTGERAVRGELFKLLLTTFAPLADRIIDTLGPDGFPTDRLPPTQDELAEKLPRAFLFPAFRPERLDIDLFGLDAPGLILAGKLMLVWAKWANVPGRDRPAAYRDREYLPWAACLVNRYREDVYTWRVLLHPFDWAIRAFNEVAKTAEAGPQPPAVAAKPAHPAVVLEQQHPPLPMAGDLRLRVDDARRTISRDGFEATVKLQDSRIQWAIFKKLVENRDVPVAHDAIAALWEEHGIARRPSVGTVNDAVGDLRTALMAIGLTIVVKRKVGRLLAELPPTVDKAKPRRRKKKK